MFPSQWPIPSVIKNTNDSVYHNTDSENICITDENIGVKLSAVENES